MSRQARNAHAGDGYKVYCNRCRHNHTLCPPLEEGCSYGRSPGSKYGWRTQWWHRHLLILRDGYRCYACGTEPTSYFGLDKEKAQISLEIQHILPVSKGGSNCLHDLVLLCHSCHVGTFSRGYAGIPKNTVNSWSELAKRVRKAQEQI